MKNKYDVVIVGAGPAGLSCAETLANNGKSILVLEKNNKIGHKICAGGLTVKIEEESIVFLKNADNVFYSMKLHFSKACRKLDRNNLVTATIDREELGKIMLKKVLKGGVEVKTETEVKEINENSIIVNGQEIKFDYLVGADGSNSTVRRYLGVKTKKMLVTLQYVIPQKIQNFKEMEYFFNSKILNGYFWIFPHKNFTAVGVAYYPKNVQQNTCVKKCFEKWLEKYKIKIGGLKLKSFPISFDYRDYQFGNKFLIGDAGGFASGATGEGIYFAMVSGKEVAKKIIDPQYDCSEILKILKIKRKQEYFFEKIGFLNNIIPNLGFNILSFFLNYKWFKKIFIKIFI
ncbi:MAG: NAD(P)/FAD-dependent oxidoreductase [Candidatus Pacebacteria bacterium]|nr:NAD(P)/FAD-dependent oxidoreductase [Candidatus Paceibacterota bacterium]